MTQVDPRTAFEDAARNDALDLLRVIAGLENGERLLNRVLQRFNARVNAMPLPRLAMVAHVRGGVGIVFAPNQRRLEDELDLTEPALLDRIRLQRALCLDDAAFSRLRSEIREELRHLLELAILGAA